MKMQDHFPNVFSSSRAKVQLTCSLTYILGIISLQSGYAGRYFWLNIPDSSGEHCANFGRRPKKWPIPSFERHDVQSGCTSAKSSFFNVRNVGTKIVHFENCDCPSALQYRYICTMRMDISLVFIYIYRHITFIAYAYVDPLWNKARFEGGTTNTV